MEVGGGRGGGGGTANAGAGGGGGGIGGASVASLLGMFTGMEGKQGGGGGILTDDWVELECIALFSANSGRSGRAALRDSGMDGAIPGPSSPL